MRVIFNVTSIGNNLINTPGNNFTSPLKVDRTLILYTNLFTEYSKTP